MNMSGKFDHVEKHLKSFSNFANRFNHYKHNRFIKKIVIWVITTTGSKKGCRKRIFLEQHFCGGGGGGGGRGANGEKWRKMAKNGDGEFTFFICQIRHFSPSFDFGISHLTDF